MEKKWMREDWRAEEGMLPEGWQGQAKEKGARKRVRKVGGAGEFLRLALLHAGGTL